jgi:hypothetical protein
MRDAWYLAEADKPVGPLSVEELKRNLHRFKDWKERLVWHSSFNEWRKAGAMPDLAPRADLLWDDEARGLCLRVYGDGSKSFVFIYCVDGHQRFLRIGQSPEWSLEAARSRAKELRSIVDQGHDPRLSECCGRSEPPSVEGLTRYVAEHTQTIQLLRQRAVGSSRWAAKLVSKGEARFIAPNVIKLFFSKRRSAKLR